MFMMVASLETCLDAGVQTNSCNGNNGPEGNRLNLEANRYTKSSKAHLGSIDFPVLDGMPEIRSTQYSLLGVIQAVQHVGVENPDTGLDSFIEPLAVVFNDVLGRLRKVTGIDNVRMVENVEHECLQLPLIPGGNSY
jgi:hypothetical protein